MSEEIWERMRIYAKIVGYEPRPHWSHVPVWEQAAFAGFVKLESEHTSEDARDCYERHARGNAPFHVGWDAMPSGERFDWETAYRAIGSRKKENL